MNSSAITFSPRKPYHRLSSGNLIGSFPQALVRREGSGKFMHTLVHEIRNPLTSINLAIEALKQMVRDENQKMYLDIITRNSGRIKDIVTDVLTSRKRNGLKPGKHSVKHIMDEILGMNEDRFILKGVTVRKNYTRDYKIECNRPKMKIALANIIINAIEAMPAKNGHLEITTKLLHGVYVIVIKDNGTGISKENLNNIFKPYFTNKPGGMGLGLPGTLSILNSNNVGINVRSELGRGTSFILSYKKELF